MRCSKAKSLLTLYVDGRLQGSEYHPFRRHLNDCESCSSEFAAQSATARMLNSIGQRSAPPDLQLKLKLAISREVAKRRERTFAAFKIRLENALNAFMVPATAGLVSAVIIFGLLIGFFAVPTRDNDVPTMLYTPPQLADSQFGLSPTINSESVVVEAYVDANGRVQDYRVLSAPDNKPIEDAGLKNMMIFTVFRPATSFGRPTSGRAVLTFSKINVKG